MSVWKTFRRACEDSNKQAVCYTKFIELWKEFHPNVVVTKPMTDLCFTCQQNTSKCPLSSLPSRGRKIWLCSGTTTVLKFSSVRKGTLQKGLRRVKVQFWNDGRPDKPWWKLWGVFTANYSALLFWYIFQVIRCSQDQFTSKMPRKCAIFGVTCKAIPRQVNFLVDEASEPEREQTQLLAMSTIILNIMDLERHLFISMPITVRVRTKTTRRSDDLKTAL